MRERSLWSARYNVASSFEKTHENIGVAAAWTAAQRNPSDKTMRSPRVSAGQIVIMIFFIGGIRRVVRVGVPSEATEGWSACSVCTTQALISETFPFLSVISTAFTSCSHTGEIGSEISLCCEIFR